MRPAVFLDRDGVIVEELHLLKRLKDIRMIPGAAAALRSLADAGFARVVVTNQPIIARGHATVDEVNAVNREIETRLVSEGAPPMDAYCVCPHHPRAALDAYRLECECRKPRPGLLVNAAEELGLNLARSFIVGDRLSDIAAGLRAGCRGVLVHSGAHEEALIESSDPVRDHDIPDHCCADLSAAARWIISVR